jgi:pantoate--beta-alanine ligase
MEVPMDVVNDGREMQRCVLALRESGRRIGLVPTMGALHEGHLSLVRKARAACDIAVATIFVNPTQFGPKEDFSKYPRTLDSDLAMLKSEGTDLVFVPEKDAIYPPGFSTYVEPPAVATTLEGTARPGHFRGVATVVLKLFHLVPAHIAFFGQKDFQQSLVIRRMVCDLDLPIEIQVCPTVREPDGLAMSSRNRYLSEPERQQAAALSRGLRAARQRYRDGVRDAGVFRQEIERSLSDAGIRQIDYVAIADGDSLQPVESADERTVALIAARLGTTRLIDNAYLSE